MQWNTQRGKKYGEKQTNFTKSINIQDTFDYFEYLEINPCWVKPKCMLLHLENIAEETSHMKNTNRIATNQQCSKQHQQHLQQQKEPKQCRQRLFKLCSMMLHNKFKKKNREHLTWQQLSGMACSTFGRGNKENLYNIFPFLFVPVHYQQILYFTIASANPFPSEVQVQIHNAFV